MKAVAAMWEGLFGLTLRLGSLSWFVSLLSEAGIMLTTLIMASYLLPWMIA